MSIYKLSEIASWLHLAVLKEGVIRSFQHNSRSVQPGDLFFAFKGEKVDGHMYLQEVANQGGIAAVVSQSYEGESYGLELLPVDDVVEALHQLAKSAFLLRKSRIVGVTGSVGKTTTKEFAATLLEGQFLVEKTPGNANSRIGIPLSILNSAGNEDVFVMEMGMSAHHEIKKLIEIAPPEIALLTRVALAHSAFFPNGLEEIAEAKAEIFSDPKTEWGIATSQALGFSPVQKVGNCQKVSYALEEDCPGADYILQRVGLCYQVVERGEKSPLFQLPFKATHLCENFLGAAVICRKMGMEWQKIIAKAQLLKAYKHRFEQIEINGILFLNDSYNANVASVKAALYNLPIPQAGGKTIAVLGSMRELGRFCIASHLEVAELASQVIDCLICLGQECKPIVDYFNQREKRVEWVSSLSEIGRHISDLAKPGDVVLLKGSNSHQLWKVLDLLRN